MADKQVTLERHPPVSKPSPPGKREDSRPRSVFLLSPANSSGIRARMLFSPSARFDLAHRLRNSSAPLGEVFTFVSGLYFRGKLTYAKRFSNPPSRIAGVYVITGAAGLLLPKEPMNLARLKSISATHLNPDNPEYRDPLDRDAFRLLNLLEPETQVVLLGSIATPKYVLPLLEVFGERLLFPRDFVGRGNMSRGGLLLRCCSLGSPLEYDPVLGAIRRGRRPPRLRN